MAKSVVDSLVQLAAVLTTQTGADSVANTEIQTGISTNATFGWLIESVEFYLPTATGAFETIPLATDQQGRMQLHKGASQGAFLALNDDNLICDWQWFMPTVAGSVGNPFIESPYIWKAPENFVVVAPVINIRLDTVGTGLTQTYATRIFYYPVQLSEMDVLRMLAA